MKKKRDVKIFLSFLLGFAALGRAQILPFEHYSIKDGLPSNWLTTIFQDSRGYLWIGGDGGMSVYDGVNFKNYGTDDGLPVGHVWCIQESRKAPGTMLIGTHGGLSKLQGGKITSLTLSNISVANVVAKIVEDREGVIWCGTAWGVYRVEGDRVSYFATGKDTSWVPILQETRDGRILISIKKSLYRYSPATKTTARVQLNIDPVLLTCMVEDEDGTLWFGAENGAIYQVRDDRVVASRQTPFGAMNDALADTDGNLWFATGAGLIKIPQNNFVASAITQYTTAHGLPDIDFQSCFRDRENNLWFASRNQGLVKLSESRLFTFPIKNLQPDVLNRAAVADSAGHLFVVSGEGLWEIWQQHAGGWQKFLHRLPAIYRQGNHRELSQRLIAADIAPDGRLWLTVHDGGLFGYKLTSRKNQASLLTLVHTLKPGVDLPKGLSVGIRIDRDNQLWYDIWNGPLVQVDLGELTQRTSHKLEGNTTRAIGHDNEGNLWAGTFNGGISVLARENGNYRLHRRLTISDGLPSNQIRSLVRRRNGEIWIGTRFNGIAIYQEGKFQTLTMKNGLLNNAIWALAEDDDGRMWIGTSVGIQYTAPENSHRFLMQQKLFGKHFGAVGAIPHAKAIWGVSNEELTIYEYGRESALSPPPFIYITGLRVNGNERAVKDAAKFSHSENSWRIEFTGLSFKDEKALRYKYRLLGWDERWQEATTERAVTFVSLRSGAYTFEVSAMTADGVESAGPASLRFEILPPFWQRWWFIAFCAVILGCVLYAIHVVRLDRLLEIEKIRSRIATDLHDDIGAGLTHIGLLSQVALQKKAVHQFYDDNKDENSRANAPEVQSAAAAIHELGHAMERVGNIARALSASMSDVVWSVNPQHDSAEALQRRLSVFAHEICRAQNIALQFEVSPQLAGMKLHPEIRRNLLLIAKEALHNVAKYSGSPSVSVKFETNGKNLIVEIADAGKGFDLAHAKFGNGLANMRTRAEKLGGKCEIVSEPSKGTRVRAEVPIK
jgi:ligand-binding sensor domain-containing protein/signal transduction histidine kinase